MRAIKILFVIFTLPIVAFLTGCAAVSVPLALEGADAGMALSGSANARSFTNPTTQVHKAALQALGKMKIEIVKDTEKDGIIKMKGKTKDHLILMTLYPVTSAVTKVTVHARINWLKQDQSVATEILYQMSRTLRHVEPEKPAT